MSESLQDPPMNSEPVSDRAMQDIPASYSPPRPKSRAGLVLTAMLVAFVGGIAATIWGVPTIRQWWDPASAPLMQDAAQTVPAVGPVPSVTAPALPPVPTTPQTVSGLEARLAEVSARLDTVSAQADLAGGNAVRAECLLIAFATRRALDRGAPLGYLENELRLRFGDAQPRAVATIITAAHAPVTLADLQGKLDDVAPLLTGAPAALDWWSALKQEVSNLIIIRKSTEPSPVPVKTIERARLLIASGRVGEAVREIERLPNHERADNWVQMARQYNEARRALDVIEAAAILEPRTGASAPVRPGTAVQVAPPPPAAQPATNATAPAATD